MGIITGVVAWLGSLVLMFVFGFGLWRLLKFLVDERHITWLQLLSIPLGASLPVVLTVVLIFLIAWMRIEPGKPMDPIHWFGIIFLGVGLPLTLGLGTIANLFVNPAVASSKRALWAGVVTLVPCLIYLGYVLMLVYESKG